MSVFIIAEIGSAWVSGTDWNVNFRNAIQAIIIAKQAGADAIKFQWTSDAVEMAERRKVDDPAAYWRLAWQLPMINNFVSRCNTVGLEFMCTVYLPKDVATIEPYVKRFKIASLEAPGRALWRAVNRYNKPVIVSTGCCDHDKVTQLPWWTTQAKFLHCTAAYPCVPEEANLKVLTSETWPYFDGLSDHTCNVMTGAFATCCGAEILEVHFRLDRTPHDNPDYPHSHAPQRLAKYIRHVRLAERMLGDGIKRVTPGEQVLVQHRVVA